MSNYQEKLDLMENRIRIEPGTKARRPWSSLKNHRNQKVFRVARNPTEPPLLISICGMDTTTYWKRIGMVPHGKKRVWMFEQVDESVID